MYEGLIFTDEKTFIHIFGDIDEILFIFYSSNRYKRIMMYEIKAISGEKKIICEINR